MRRLEARFWFTAFLVGSMAVTLATQYAQAAFPVPSGFNLLTSGTGVQVYKKDYRGGQPDYVTAVNMTQATFAHLHGSIDSTKGDSRGKAVRKESFNTHVNLAFNQQTDTRKLITVVNGTFFFTDDQPARISFGLKANGNVISYGSDLSGYEGLYRTFAFKPDRANIQVHGDTTFNNQTIPEVIGGLDPAANKSKTSRIHRTFLGLRDDDGNSTYETVFIFSGAYANQADATNVLKAFGASPDKIIMMDGGGSGALYVASSRRDRPLVSYSGRAVPHTIAVYAGK